jgi:hypothetical protein
VIIIMVKMAKVKVKLFHYRPRKAFRVPGGLGCQNF